MSFLHEMREMGQRTVWQGYQRARDALARARAERADPETIKRLMAEFEEARDINERSSGQFRPKPKQYRKP
jgi:hypothetical protein